MTTPAYTPTVTRKITEARLVYCADCDHWWTDCDPVPWTLRNTVHMHRRGCPTHTLTFYR